MGRDWYRARAAELSHAGPEWVGQALALKLSFGQGVLEKSISEGVGLGVRKNDCRQRI